MPWLKGVVGGIGSAGGSGVLRALEAVPNTIGSAGSAIGDAASSLGTTLADLIPSSFGGGAGSEAALLERLGQAVPQGVELVGSTTDRGTNGGAASTGGGDLSEVLPTAFGGGLLFDEARLEDALGEGAPASGADSDVVLQALQLLEELGRRPARPAPALLPRTALLIMPAPELSGPERALRIIRAFQDVAGAA